MSFGFASGVFLSIIPYANYRPFRILLWIKKEESPICSIWALSRSKVGGCALHPTWKKSVKGEVEDLRLIYFCITQILLESNKDEEEEANLMSKHF